jgi:MoaA/NifB/PqqE/SkfB family radical SAM enzyme
MIYLLLTGGEPFLRPDFREIFQGLHKMGFVMSINTNGTLIDEDTVQWLKQTAPTRINITLYGASNETYARLCGNPQGFSQAVKAIHLLKEAGITVRVNCSLTPQNAADAEGIFDFVRKEGLLVQATSYMFPPVRRDLSMIGCNTRFSPEEAAYYSAKISSLMYGEDDFLNSLENGLPPIPAETEDCPELTCEGEGIRCRAGKCSFWVTWTGAMMPCGMLPVEDPVNVFEVGFPAAWQRTRDAAAEIRLPGQCASCAARDHCKACAAMVYTESGNYQTVPQYRCEMTRAYPAACKQLAADIMNRRENNENAE